MLSMYPQGQLERLDNAACIKEYAKIFETERSHLIPMFDKPGNVTQEPLHYSTWEGRRLAKRGSDVTPIRITGFVAARALMAVERMPHHLAVHW